MRVADHAPPADPGRDLGKLARTSLVTLVAFSAAAIGAGLGRAILTSYLPVLLDQNDTEPGVIGTVMLVNAGAGFAVPLVVGIWSDRLKERGHGRVFPFILGGAVLGAGGFVAVALGSESSFLMLALFGGVAYVGLNAVTTAHRALIPESFESPERARGTGAQEFAMLFGGLAGIVAGGIFIEIAPWAPFLLASLALPLFALPTVVRTLEAKGAEAPERKERSRPGGYYLRAASRPGVRTLLAAQILWVLGYAALPAFFILYAEDVLGLRPSVAAVFLAAFGIFTGITMLVAGRTRDPASHKPLLVLGVALMGGGFLAVAAASTVVLAGPGLLAAAVGFGVVSTIGFPLYSALIPKGEAGSYTALYFSVRAISSAVALPAAGWAITATGSFRSLFILGGAVTLTALVPLVRVPAPERVSRLRSVRSIAVPPRRWLLSWTGAVVSVAALVLALGLLLGATGLGADEAVFRAVNGIGHGPQLMVDIFDPHTRNYFVLTAIAVLATAMTRPLRIPHTLTFVTLSWLLAVSLQGGMHVIWSRPRPEEVLGADALLLGGRSWAEIASYPSGHMVITTALVTSTSRLFPQLRLPLLAYLAIVALTRVLYGAHFPLDVIGGMVVGYGSALAVEALLVKTRILEPRVSEGLGAVLSRLRVPASTPGTHRSSSLRRAPRS